MKKIFCLLILIIWIQRIYSINEYDTLLIGIKDFLVLNSAYMHSSDSILNEILNNKRVILTYKQNDFTIMWVDSDTASIDNYLFAYILEGFDKDWILTKHDRKTRYTNLEPGNYLFKIKYAKDNIWNNEAYFLNITIIPPFWKTWTFKVLLLLIIIIVFRITIKKINNSQHLIE